MPDLTTMRGSIGGELARLRHSMNTILSVSFFITKNMKSELRAGRVNGALPILYVFLVRSGYTIREVTPVSVGSDGALQPGGDAARSGPAPGIKIVFAGSDGEARTLYYFSTNLADDGVKNSNFLKFCETLAPGDGFIKSASYLLHSGGFNRVRDFLLVNGAAMIQDDFGIPLAYYDPQKWDLQPFGRYLGPIGIFPGRHQAKYTELFKKSRPIDFGIGYRHRPSESNLLLAVKKAPVSQTEATGADPTSSTGSRPKPPSPRETLEARPEIPVGSGRVSLRFADVDAGRELMPFCGCASLQARETGLDLAPERLQHGCLHADLFVREMLR